MKKNLEKAAFICALGVVLSNNVVIGTDNLVLGTDGEMGDREQQHTIYNANTSDNSVINNKSELNGNEGNMNQNTNGMNDDSDVEYEEEADDNWEANVYTALNDEEEEPNQKSDVEEEEETNDDLADNVYTAINDDEEGPNQDFDVDKKEENNDACIADVYQEQNGNEGAKNVDFDIEEEDHECNIEEEQENDVDQIDQSVTTTYSKTNNDEETTETKTEKNKIGESTVNCTEDTAKGTEASEVTTPQTYDEIKIAALKKKILSIAIAIGYDDSCIIPLTDELLNSVCEKLAKRGNLRWRYDYHEDFEEKVDEACQKFMYRLGAMSLQKEWFDELGSRNANPKNCCSLVVDMLHRLKKQYDRTTDRTDKADLMEAIYSIRYWELQRNSPK